MKRNGLRVIAILSVVFFTVGFGWSQADGTGASGSAPVAGAPPAADLIKKAEKLMYPNAKVEGTLIFDDGKGRKEAYAMTSYTRDLNQRIIVRFTTPASMIGNDLLMIEQNVWSYDRGTGRVLKVPSNQSFGGSGFAYGDVVRLNWSDNYSATVTGQTSDQWKLELTAKDRNAPYFRIELTIDKTGGWPVKGVCYARSGAIVKEMSYSGIKNLGGARFPAILSVTSPDAPGEVTTMTLSRVQLKDYPENIFNRRNLETHLEENL